ncbi:MAG: plasmid stabilization protein [Hymenobacter sp.]|nr:MAG: plasmid stabilization protein [Hymenobacter sp.]
MKTTFNRHFLKDIGKLPTAELKNEIADIILAVEAANNLAEVQNTKKLKGFKTAYRIRVGDFRIGLVVTQQTVEFVRVVNRKDIYKLFP